MISISQKDIKTFEENGWCIAKINLDEVKLNEYITKIKNIEKLAKINHFKPGRIYYDYLLDYNLAAVEAPFSSKVCSEKVLEFFKEIRVGDAICKLTNWNSSICTLVRLFCMGRYNYSGNWHQDDIFSQHTMQVSIALKNENGFKILKKNFINSSIIKEKIYKMNKINPKLKMPIKIDRKYYDTINLQKGEVFFFNPFQLHKGSCFDSRLQFHMRFNLYEKQKYLKDSYEPNILDFHLLKKYEPNFNYENLCKIFPKVNRSKFLVRFIKTLNYYLPLQNIYYFIRQKFFDSTLDYELFSNTFYQRK